MNKALRIDDIGASSKKYEIYSKFHGGNILFLKYMQCFRAWGSYREMTVNEWNSVFNILEKFNAKLTVGVTATWVEADGTLVPFPEKFQEEAAKLKEGVKAGLLEIANHGLTHCVVGKHLPRLFFSNRKYHREFWGWLDTKVHFEHIKRSQQILQNYFGMCIETLVPPGNVFTESTIIAARENGIKVINCYTKSRNVNGVRILSEENVTAFHDRELVLEGVDWLERKLEAYEDVTYYFVKEL